MMKCLTLSLNILLILVQDVYSTDGCMKRILLTHTHTPFKRVTLIAILLIYILNYLINNVTDVIFFIPFLHILYFYINNLEYFFTIY